MAGTIKKIRTPAELRAIARSQVGSEMQGQISPWQIQRNQLQTRRQRALDNMNTLFTGLAGYNQQALQTLGGFNEHAGDLQSQAFQQAQSRLDQFRQQRAADAQALAQQTGGPVPISAFTDGVDPGSVRSSAAGGALMGAIGAGQDQTAEMGRFTTEVFPLVQAEESKTTQQNFEDSINAVQSEIANLKGQKGGLINKRYADLLASERDYQIAGGTLGLNKRAQALTRQGSIDPKTGQPYSHEEFVSQQRQAKQQAALDRAAAVVGKSGLTAHTAQKQQSYALLDQLTKGTSGTAQTTSYRKVGFMSPRTAANKGYVLNPADTKKDKDGNRAYYKPVQEKQTISGAGAIGPGEVMPGTVSAQYPQGLPYGEHAFEILYDKLRGYGTPPRMAKNIINQYFSLGGKWTPKNYKPGPALNKAGYTPVTRPPKPGKKKKVKMKNRKP